MAYPAGCFTESVRMNYKRFAFLTIILCVLLYLSLGQTFSLTQVSPKSRVIADESSSRFCNYANCSRTKANGKRCNFSEVDNSQGIGFDEYVVPNIVHYIRFKKPQFSFFEFVCLKTAYYQINPDQFYIHTDNTNITGEHWEEIKAMPYLFDKIRLIPTEIPTEVFGKPLSKGWHLFHASDVARIQIMRKYGGIYLDDDVYIVKNLHKYRRYEMAIGWESTYMGSQVLIAHKDARFLKLWWESYRDYRSDLWYYNAGEYPSKEFIEKQPKLVHVVYELFNSKFYELRHKLYQTNWTEWTNFEAIHLAVAHRNSDDERTKKYPVLTKDNIAEIATTVTDMALAVYNRTDISHSEPPVCFCCMYSDPE